MCGIVGFVDKSKNKKKIIKEMADKIIHRGPDSDGYYVNHEVALGFRRLSIIDLDSGSQPIYNEKKDKVIIFNGEIYNYKQLKEDLIKCGHKFKSEADTEVILHGYEEYGTDLLMKLRGMFAFVIYDIKKEELFGARDFYGIKPFYYYNDNKSFMFGSEIKSFLAHPCFKKELNEKMLDYYLTFQYSVFPETFFKNVYKLMPGHYFKYKKGKLDIVKYYELKFEADENKSLEYFEKQIEELLNDSVAAHKVSDVEVGSFLSSGVDSSLIVSKALVDKTFTVGWDNFQYSEIDYAKELSDSLGIKNISKKISKKEYFDNFAKIQYFMDEPLADPSAVALFFVAKEASKHVKVALSGEGADEIFGGYNIYHEPYSVSWYYKIPYIIRRFLGVIVYPFRYYSGFNFIYRRSRKLSDRYIGNAFIFDEVQKKKILKNKDNKLSFKDITKSLYKKYNNYDDVTTMQYIDFNTWLIGDILLKADKMSMANSLEVRVPYLDRILIDNIRKMPTKYKICNGQTKYAFRNVAKKELASKIADKKKLGFPVPIRVWLREKDTYDLVRNMFLSDDEFFDKRKIIKLLDEHYKGKRDNSRKIWTVYTFLVWYQEYFL